MELSSFHAHPSLAATIAILLLLAYPFVVFALSRYRRDRTAPMSASAIPATLAPLFIGVAATWLGLMDLMNGLARGGGGRVASAAGIAEALFTIEMAGIVAVIVSAGMLIRRGPASEDRGPESVHVAAIGAIGFLVALLTVQLSLAGTIIDRISQESMPRGAWIPGAVTGVVAGAITAAIGALVSLLWLILSRRFASLRVDRHCTAIAAGCALASLLLSWLVWRIMQTYVGIAKGG